MGRARPTRGRRKSENPRKGEVSGRMMFLVKLLKVTEFENGLIFGPH
jgi:hypothetical protein